DFRSDSRRNNRRIVHYVTVIATQKLDKRQSKVGKLFPVGCALPRLLGKQGVDEFVGMEFPKIVYPFADTDKTDG
ncbi:MAG: hypothetical protein BECKG1743F_GA0114225_109962, partial [Candidatus Kentron sp. G]